MGELSLGPFVWIMFRNNFKGDVEVFEGHLHSQAKRADVTQSKYGGNV